jgi:N-acetylmuramoyl-L-alanine amidase
MRGPWRAAAFAAAPAAALLLGAASASAAGGIWGVAPAATVRFAGADRDTFAVALVDEVPYLSVNVVARALAATKSWDTESLALLLRIGGHEVRLAVGNTVATVDRRSVLLSGPALLRDGVVRVPLDFLTERLVLLSGGRVAWDEAARELSIGAETDVDALGARVVGDSLAARERAPGEWRGFAVRTVVIDPGHGGAEDPGARAGALVEKDVALGVALAARSLIEQRLGARVVLTRESDEAVPVGRRGEIANTEGGDLFLSIHCNASSDPEAAGFEAGVAAVDAADAARAAPRASDEIRFIPWSLVQAPFVEESAALAESMADALGREAAVANRGVRRGRFAVLAGVAMPATLVEIGFVTNAGDAALLSAADFRARVAEGIARGVEAFAGRRAASDAPTSGAGAPALASRGAR